MARRDFLQVFICPRFDTVKLIASLKYPEFRFLSFDVEFFNRFW